MKRIRKIFGRYLFQKCSQSILLILKKFQETTSELWKKNLIQLKNLLQTKKLF